MTGTEDMRLPPERFYWAVLPTGRLPRSPARRAAQLGYLLESVLPEPIEAVHAVYEHLDQSRFLACGMTHEDLAQHQSRALIALGPDHFPAFIAVQMDDAVHPAAINLLVGRHEPEPVGAARRRATLALAVLLVLVTAIAIIGQRRRAAHLRVRLDQATAAIDSVYDRVLGPTVGGAPREARLTAEIRSLERTRSPRPGASGPAEIAPHLGAMLASWPDDLHAATDQLSAGPALLSLTVRLPDGAAAETFERALRAPPGWRKAQPSIETDRGEITMRVRMEREGAP